MSGPMLQDCVATWLLDLRRAVEMECTSILLAKPIPTRPMPPGMCSSQQPSPATRRPVHLSLDAAQPELILGGRIPVGLSDGEASCRPSHPRRPPPPPCASQSLSVFVPQNQNPKQHRLLNTSFLTAINHHDDEEEDEATAIINRDCGDSALELLCNGSSNASSSSDEKETNQFKQGPYDDQRAGGLTGDFVDNCSLDSACGSSPVLSNNDHTDSNDTNDTNDTNANDATSSGNSNTPSGSPSTAVHLKRDSRFPMYPQLKESVDHLLHSASHMYARIDTLSSGITDDKLVRNVVQKVKSFFELADKAGFCAVLPFKDFVNMKSQVEDLYYGDAQTRRNLSGDFALLVKSLAEKVLGFFAKIILGYLAECNVQDVYLYSALKHLAHVSLFGEDVCLEVIQFGGVPILFRLCRQLSDAAPETLKQILRTLAVLCSVSKGCVQLLSVGGLDLISRLLNGAPFVIGVEAAGVLTQLTAPCHSFAILPTSLSKVVLRLLDMCELCIDCESLLLCSAALANLTLQHSSVSEQLYTRNAVARLCTTFAKQQQQPSVFVMDQLATILARLSANGYDQALIAQGAIPTLLRMLRLDDSKHAELCRRIRHKAALCLGSLASQPFGLKAVHESNGRQALQDAMQICEHDGQQNPVQMICHNLLQRINARYELESAV